MAKKDKKEEQEIPAADALQTPVEEQETEQVAEQEAQEDAEELEEPGTEEHTAQEDEDEAVKEEGTTEEEEAAGAESAEAKDEPAEESADELSEVEKPEKSDAEAQEEGESEETAAASDGEDQAEAEGGEAEGLATTSEGEDQGEEEESEEEEEEQVADFLTLPAGIKVKLRSKYVHFEGSPEDLLPLSKEFARFAEMESGLLVQIDEVQLRITDKVTKRYHERNYVEMPRKAWKIFADSMELLAEKGKAKLYDFNDSGYLFTMPFSIGFRVLGEAEEAETVEEGAEGEVVELVEKGEE